MSGASYPYLDLGGPVRDGEVVCRFRVVPREGVTAERAADAVAAESSIGTWTEVATLGADLRDRLRARVVALEGERVTVVYPAALFEPGNMAQIYSSVAGNIFGMKEIASLRLEALRLPPALATSFPGPAYGVAGIRATLGVKGRPLVGTIVKPKIGLPPQEQAKVVYEAMAAGCDVVKDDENLTSQAFCPFEERLRLCLDAARRAEDETGCPKGYIPNVTAPAEVMLRRAGLVAHLGGPIAMVDLVTAGWSAVQSLRNAGLPLILHGHRAMHAAFTRDPAHGIAMAVLARSARLCGIDQLHVGTAVGKMEGSAGEVLRSAAALTATPAEDGAGADGQRWDDCPPALPIASGGLHPGHVPAVIALLGHDVVLQFGGGIHGHPDGTAAGARAARQAVDATLAGQTLAQAARSAPELARALERWGATG